MTDEVPLSGDHSPQVTVASECLLATTTPECILPRASSAMGRVDVVIDGWIDNRAEIALSLGLERSTSVTKTIASLYSRRGVSGIDTLIGDFALVIWDPDERMLICARDVAGVRPLFYAHSESGFVCATRLAQLCRSELVRPRIDAAYFAEYLAGCGQVSSRTPYEGMKRVLPGGVVTFKNGTVRTDWFWYPRRRDLIRCEAEAVDGFRDHFETAVRRCLNHRGAVWSELSGGVDSASIVCVASRASRRETAPRPSFETITVDFAAAAHSDETRFATEIARHVDVRQHHIRYDFASFFHGWRENVAYWDEPNASIFAGPLLKQYVALIEQRGVTALLNGMGAEAVVTCSQKEPFYLCDEVRRWRMRHAARGLVLWQRAKKRPMVNICWDYVLRPLIWPDTATYQSGPSQLPKWLTPASIRRFELNRAMNRRIRPRMFSDLADQWQYDRIAHVSAHLSRGMLERFVDVRYPFLSKPLMEFMLAMPWELKMRPVGTKPILRLAMSGVVPDSVRLRPYGVTTGGHSRYLALERNWPEVQSLAEGRHLGDLGLVDSNEFRRHVALARAGHAPEFAVLLSALASEAWLTAIADGQYRVAA
jgi:asparagine synthase (glutamine-hydrolysing)